MTPDTKPTQDWPCFVCGEKVPTGNGTPNEVVRARTCWTHAIQATLTTAEVFMREHQAETGHTFYNVQLVTT